MDIYKKIKGIVGDKFYLNKGSALAVAEYIATATYSLNEIVSSAGGLYKSLQNNNVGNTPASSPTYWTAVTGGGGHTQNTDQYLDFGGANQVSAAQLKNEINLHTVTKEQTGFTAPESVIVTYDSTARTITLTGTVVAYWRGSIVTSLVSGWVSDPHTNSNAVYYLYYDGDTSSFVWNTTGWTFDKLQIAMVNFGATDKFAIRECHGFMEYTCHETFHRSIGTFRESGGDITGITIGSTTAAQRRPDVSATILHDEDLETTNPSLTSKLYSQMFLTSTGVADFTLSAADIIPLSGNNPYINSFSAPNWGQTLFPANSIGTVWLVAMPVTASAGSQAYRYAWVQPQWITQAAGSNANQLATARATEAARQPSEVTLGNLSSPEFVFICRIMIQYTASNWTVQAITNITGTKATQVLNPAGITSAGAVSVDTTNFNRQLSATEDTVQRALDKLDNFTSNSYIFSTTTTDSDPGTNTFRFNNATIASATYLYLDDLAFSGADMGTMIALFKANNRIYIQDKTTEGSNYILCKVTGNPVDGTGYWKIPITVDASSVTTLANLDVCEFSYTMTLSSVLKDKEGTIKSSSSVNGDFTTVNNWSGSIGDYYTTITHGYLQLQDVAFYTQRVSGEYKRVYPEWQIQNSGADIKVWFPTNEDLYVKASGVL